jgi:uncharacterized protein (DUF2147 family)
MASWSRAGFLAGAILAWGTVALAQTAPTPIGRWRSFDDKTGQPKSIIAITEINGELQGTVERVFSPPAPNSNPSCDKCSGDRKNKPIVGMQMLWGMKKDGDEYSGGHILEPETGKEVRAKMKVVEGGQKLEVRGFVGFALAGRTAMWTRE